EVRPAREDARPDGDGGADPPVHAGDRRDEPAEGRGGLLHREPEGRARLLHPLRGRRGAVAAEDARALVHEPPGAQGDPAGPPARRHRRRPGVDRLRDGGVRQVTLPPSKIPVRPLEKPDPKQSPARGTRSTGYGEAAGAPPAPWPEGEAEGAAVVAPVAPAKARPSPPPPAAPRPSAEVPGQRLVAPPVPGRTVPKSVVPAA